MHNHTGNFWRTLTLMAALAAPAAAFAADITLTPADIAAASAAADGALTHEQLKSHLEGLGYDVTTLDSTAGTPIYELNFQQRDFRYVIRVALSSDGQRLFLDAPLKILPESGSLPAERVLRLLEENSKITPMAFRYDRSGNQPYLIYNLPNAGLTPSRLRTVLGEVMQTLADTQALWNPAKWQPLPAETAQTVDPQSDLGRLQGEWIVTSGIGHGMPFTPEQLQQRFTLKFTGDRLTLLGSTFTVHLDPETHAITVIAADGITRELGIYRLEGEQLTINLANAGQPRPTDFAGTADTTLFSAERSGAS